MEDEISSYILKLRASHPFFATISLFAKYHFSCRIEFFETDGQIITINPEYFRRLESSEKTGLLLHVTLHTALLHPLRRHERDEVVWNIAADIVVNNIILECNGLKPPRNTLTIEKYKDKSVEQVYELIMDLSNTSDAIRSAARQRTIVSAVVDPLEKGGEYTPPPQRKDVNQILKMNFPHVSDLCQPKNINDTERHVEKINQHWKSVFRKAELAERLANQNRGIIPEGLLLEVGVLENPMLDWRLILWDFVVRTPSDFEGYDRRFIYQQLYLDHLESQSLRVLVAIDTSGSIDAESLNQFVSELLSIERSYHFIEMELYYVDAEVYGPFTVHDLLRENIVIGGGGTSFSVFFDNVVSEKYNGEVDLVVYFTDGNGEFPCDRPDVEVLWVVSFGGLESDYFPFGHVARLNI